MKVSAVIPVYDPDEDFLDAVWAILKKGFHRVIIVDDGSAPDKRGYFEKVGKDERCVVLRHSAHLGRGRALKTAFNYFVENCGEDVGVVTADGDNNYGVEDIWRCAEELVRKPECLVLGIRDFDFSGMPKLNALGNKITAWVFKYICGIKVSDAQTGLRGIPTEFVKRLLTVSGERFDFETNMLLESDVEDIPISEFEVKEYRGGAKRTYYNPTLDSIKVYKTILTYLFSSTAATVVDILAFAVLNAMMNEVEPKQRLLVATIIARVISSALSFAVNRRLVFKAKDDVRDTGLRYFALSAAKLALSYGGIYLLSGKLHLAATPAKIITDALLGIASFKLQREWVFEAGKR